MEIDDLVALYLLFISLASKRQDPQQTRKMSLPLATYIYTRPKKNLCNKGGNLSIVEHPLRFLLSCHASNCINSLILSSPGSLKCFSLAPLKLDALPPLLSTRDLSSFEEENEPSFSGILIVLYASVLGMSRNDKIRGRGKASIQPVTSEPDHLVTVVLSFLTHQSRCPASVPHSQVLYLENIVSSMALSWAMRSGLLTYPTHLARRNILFHFSASTEPMNSPEWIAPLEPSDGSRHRIEANLGHPAHSPR